MPTWLHSVHRPSALEEGAQGADFSSARLWTHLMAARVLLAVGLLTLQTFAYAHGGLRYWLLVACGAYLLATVAALRWARPAATDSVWAPGWLFTLWVDLAFFGVLQNFQTSGINYTPLFMLPVLLASILGPLVLALGSAAFASLVLLLDVWTNALLGVGQASSYGQGAVTGTGLFLVALMVNQLAHRLQNEQAQSRFNRALAQTEAQVNQLIVTGLSEGVVVIDAHGKLWHANPAARQMLGKHSASDDGTALHLQPGWPLLVQWARNAIALQHDDECEVALPTPGGGTLPVLLRTRLTPTPAGSHDTATCVVFIENLHDVQVRVQNEKLVAMGRVSAAVAHEIRNPLAAIVQANALLSEEAQSPVQQRLTTMIGQNAQRLGRTVDDILSIVKLPPRSLADQTPPVLLDETVGQFLHDWAQQRPADRQVSTRLQAPQALVRVDPEHLRRVLVNLLDNACKHGPAGGHAICLTTWVEAAAEASATMACLELWNPGLPMPDEVQQHLFEPFNSSQSRSSGLGLYLSRELCERYGGMLAYQPQARDQQPGHSFILKWPSA